MKKIAFNDTAKLVIVHPSTGEDLTQDNGSAMSVTIYGVQSSQYRTAKNEALNKRMARRSGQATAEQIESDALELLAKCTDSFNGLDIGDGLLDVKDAKRVYRENPWLKDQVDQGMADNALFLQTDSVKKKRS